MRVLVTGGAGFIGSHTVHALLNNNHEVVVLDDLSTGTLDNLPTSDKLTLQVGDVADANAVTTALDGCDAFIHLAAVASVELSVRDPVSTHRTNLQGSIQLFNEAARQGVRRGLYASSAAVYGDSKDLPLSEGTPPRPLTPYAIDKLSGEYYLAHYHRSGALNAATFRFFNVFGPRQDPNSPYSGVVSIFLNRGLNGQPITVYGDGQQTRDFIYVGDVVGALVTALNSQTRAKEMPTYNVSTGKGVQLTQLLDTISSLSPIKAPLEISHEPARTGDIRHSVGDATRLQEGLGWRPKTSLREGLLAIINDAGKTRLEN